MGCMCTSGEPGPPTPDFDEATIRMVRTDWSKFMKAHQENGMDAFFLALEIHRSEIKTYFNLMDKSDEEIRADANVKEYVAEAVAAINDITTALENKRAVKKVLKAIQGKHWKRRLPARTIFLFKDGVLRFMTNKEMIIPDEFQAWQDFFQTIFMDFEFSNNTRK